MARTFEDRLNDIREAAADLLDIVADMEEGVFHALPHADRMAYRAIKNALSEIGEAVKAIPDAFRARHPQVDWRGFAGLRDMVMHQYFGVDIKRLLPIIKEEVPSLLAAVESEIETFPAPPNDPDA